MQVGSSMQVRVLRQSGPMGRKVGTIDVDVRPGQEDVTSARVTITTDVGPVEVAVWPNGTVSVGSRDDLAGTKAGAKLHSLWRGNAATDRQEG